MCVSCGLFENYNEKEITIKNLCVLCMCFLNFMFALIKEKGNIKCNKKCVFFAYGHYFKQRKRNMK